MQSVFTYIRKQEIEEKTSCKKFSEIYVCSSTNLNDDQQDVKLICRKFTGTTRSLSFLRENLTVKEFVQVLNCFPVLKTSLSEVETSGDETGETVFDDREIWISFFDFKKQVESVPHLELSESSDDFASEFCLDNDYFEPVYDDDFFTPRFPIKMDSLTGLVSGLSSFTMMPGESSHEDNWSVESQAGSYQDCLTPKPSMHDFVFADVSENKSKFTQAVECLKSPKFLYAMLFAASALLAFRLNRGVSK